MGPDESHRKLGEVRRGEMDRFSVPLPGSAPASVLLKERAF